MLPKTHAERTSLLCPKPFIHQCRIVFANFPHLHSNVYSRFGPFTEWLASFDTDEYFVPMGNYTSLKDVLRDLGQQGTNILSLRSSRGHLRLDHSMVVGQNNDAVEKSIDSTFLEAYKYVLFAIALVSS